jgi:hypothetical protein
MDGSDDLALDKAAAASLSMSALPATVAGAVAQAPSASKLIATASRTVILNGCVIIVIPIGV